MRSTRSLRSLFALFILARFNFVFAQSPIVDLGYSKYQGYYNETSKLNIYKGHVGHYKERNQSIGIRYAAPPTDELRWQPPQAPAWNGSVLQDATSYPPRCPQSSQSPLSSSWKFSSSAEGDEDCLFLSVWAPENATNLPVFFWIHGGGYGTGQGNNDFSELAMTNNNSFILVAIQYRLGAFGWLSSSALARHGAPNAGLLDQLFALKWTQKYIKYFGGDPKKVTIAGESAGAGSVMLLSLAYGGTLGTSLFKSGIAASPYLPMQWDFDGYLPSSYYAKFAAAAGCGTGDINDAESDSVYECLVEADTITLQNASAIVSGTETFYETFAFLPVTDGKILQHRPSQQLLAGKVNGESILIGNNADEGVGFTPQNITTAQEFNSWVKGGFPTLTNKDIDKLDAAFAIPTNYSNVLFASNGISAPFVTYQSTFGSGQQQRANNYYSETTFICPSYWLASAYAAKSPNRNVAWKYQFSVPPSEHGADLDAYYAFNREAAGEGTMSEQFRQAVQLMWGNVVTRDGDARLTDEQLAYLAEAQGEDFSAAGSNWKAWSADTVGASKYGGHSGKGFNQLNVNTSGGVEVQLAWNGINITQMAQPSTAQIANGSAKPLLADWKVVDGYSWEGGRGQRCALFYELGADVPE